MPDNPAITAERPDPRLLSRGVIQSAEVTPDGLVMEAYGILFGGRSLYNDQFLPPVEILSDPGDEVQIGTEYFFRSFSDGVDRETGEIINPEPQPLFYDHGMGVLGAMRIGTATPVRVTEKGIKYLVEVERKRAGEYWEFVNELRVEGILGFSAQSLLTFYDREYGDPGTIRSWRSAELSLTVTPAEPRLVETLREMYRKYNLPTEAIVAQNATLPEPEIEELTGPVDADVNPVDVVNQVMDAAEQQTARTVQEIQENTILASLVSLVEAQSQQIETLSRSVETLNASLDTFRQQNVDAFRTFAERIASSASRQLVRDAARAGLSSAEFQARSLALDEEEQAPPARRTSNYNLPADMPGLN